MHINWKFWGRQKSEPPRAGHTWKISIDDGYVEWEYTIVIPATFGGTSISKVKDVILAAFSGLEVSSRIRTTAQEKADDCKKRG